MRNYRTNIHKRVKLGKILTQAKATANSLNKQQINNKQIKIKNKQQKLHEQRKQNKTKYLSIYFKLIGMGGVGKESVYCR